MRTPKFLTILLCVSLVTSGALMLSSCGNKPSEQGTFLLDPAYSLPRLTAQGTSLADDSGTPVQLIGVNLGGWLVFEEWFCPLYDNREEEPKAAGSEIYDMLSSRFSDQEVEELIETYQANWITEYDLDYLASLGINCVRVPFWYRNLQDKNGEWKRTENGEIDFGRLNWIVNECGKRGIYVVLDLHGAPGYQSDAHHCGANYSMQLFDDTEEGEAYREKTSELWHALAEHFKDCGTVAGYDLLNEPYCDVTSVNYANINSLYDRLYRAVREIDTETVVIMEGIWSLDKLPDPAAMGWENVMYEVHFYDYTEYNINRNTASLTEYSQRYQVPVYVGEFESGELEIKAIEAYAATGASLTTWTYKGISTATQWFLRYATDRPDANLATDSYETILKRWGESIRTDYQSAGFFGIGKVTPYAENTVITSALSEAAGK